MFGVVRDSLFNFVSGKLEELAEPERNIYFPETSKSQPFMHVHGNPTFSILYRLVDYCYNITFINRVGEVELKPTNRLQCTFRIYMPYGNRVALKLQIGDSAAKGTLSFKNLPRTRS